MKYLKFPIVSAAVFLVTLTLVTGGLVVNAKSKLDTKQMISDLRYLSTDEFRGRAAGTPQNGLAREFIANRYMDLGLAKFDGTFYDKFSFKTRTREVEGTNVVGWIKGKKYPDKYIVITAHFDHLGVRNKQIYNGTDDNASGTAALLAFAEYFKKKQPKHSIIFAALDAEEMGLRGARHLVADLPVEKSKIALNVNMDMVSRADKNEIYIAGTYHYPQFKPILEKAVRKAKIKVLFGHDRPELKSDDWTLQSDHAAFHREKIPFVYFGVEDHPDYHKPSDDFEKIDENIYINAVDAILMSVRALDKKIK